MQKNLSDLENQASQALAGTDKKHPNYKLANQVSKSSQRIKSIFYTKPDAQHVSPYENQEPIKINSQKMTREEEKKLPPPQILIMSSGDITPFSLSFAYEGDFNDEPVYFALNNEEFPPLELAGPFESPDQ